MAPSLGRETAYSLPRRNGGGLGRGPDRIPAMNDSAARLLRIARPLRRHSGPPRGRAVPPRPRPARGGLAAPAHHPRTPQRPSLHDTHRLRVRRPVEIASSTGDGGLPLPRCARRSRLARQPARPARGHSTDRPAPLPGPRQHPPRRPAAPPGPHLLPARAHPTGTSGSPGLRSGSRSTRREHRPSCAGHPARHRRAVPRQPHTGARRLNPLTGARTSASGCRLPPR